MSTEMTRGGDVVDAYLLPDEEAVMQPYRWTEQDTLETDPDGFAPIEAAEVAEQDATEDTGSGEGALGRWQRLREAREAGVTWRVRRTRRGASEQQRLSETPDKTVIKRGSRVERAAELEELAADPRAEAYSNRRARFWLLSMAGLGIALGVGISSSTAQQTITSYMHWAVDSVAGLAAYGADPALGLVLFATLGARILASARGVAVPEVARKALNGIELVLFSLVALLNAGPSLGALLGDLVSGEWAKLGPDVMVLVIHTLGPVLVATGVFGVPYMAVILSEITAATNAKRARANTSEEPSGPSPAASSGEGSCTRDDQRRKKPTASPQKKASGGVSARVHRGPQKKSVADHEKAFTAAVAAGELEPSEVSVNQVKNHLRCQWGTADQILSRYRDGRQAA